MEKRIAVYPGSFNPFTVGHKNILDRALKLFDDVYVVFTANSSKSNEIDYDLRQKQIFKLNTIPHVHACTRDTLTVDSCKQFGANFIVRGLRDTSDFEYEKNTARVNEILSPDMQTVFILPKPMYDNVSSSMVRELKKYNVDASQFVF